MSLKSQDSCKKNIPRHSSYNQDCKSMAGHQKLVQDFYRYRMFDVIEIIVHGEHNYSQLELTKSDSQVDVDIFSILKNHLL